MTLFNGAGMQALCTLIEKVLTQKGMRNNLLIIITCLSILLWLYQRTITADLLGVRPTEQDVRQPPPVQTELPTLQVQGADAITLLQCPP
ncbi:MAG: hypothetical protein IPM12_04290 [Flavobacteriales bacterium]|nr:hypothetical protein [Flavobacteriales bacterium]